jgi:hypothetical protein
MFVSFPDQILHFHPRLLLSFLSGRLLFEICLCGVDHCLFLPVSFGHFVVYPSDLQLLVTPLVSPNVSCMQSAKN